MPSEMRKNSLMEYTKNGKRKNINVKIAVSIQPNKKDTSEKDNMRKIPIGTIKLGSSRKGTFLPLRDNRLDCPLQISFKYISL